MEFSIMARHAGELDAGGAGSPARRVIKCLWDELGDPKMLPKPRFRFLPMDVGAEVFCISKAEGASSNCVTFRN